MQLSFLTDVRSLPLGLKTKLDVKITVGLAAQYH